MIYTDWHIHSEASYDATLTLKEIAEGAKQRGYVNFGITDHVNYNDDKFLGDMKRSVDSVKEFQKECPEIILGVELTPIPKPTFDYVAKTGTREGFTLPESAKPYDIELAQTKEQLKAFGVRYAVCAAHARLDVTNPKEAPLDRDAYIKEWYRQQMWLASDERTTILGHPWWTSKNVWYDDFSVIPHSMNTDIAAVLKENKKYVECNEYFFRSDKTTDKFRHQYAEFLRELHETGIPVTYGSDSHRIFLNHDITVEYLTAAGFKDGDIVAVEPQDLW
ncbi:MAG: PHP domain-containing protein [Clostridia bacterium]|nr:PHP domain-containing protein [Clostridia bacterium]